LSPQHLHQVEHLVAAGPAILERVSAGDDLFLAPADADPEINSPAGQIVERRELLRRVDGVALRQQRHPRPEPQVLRCTGQECEGHYGLREPAALGNRQLSVRRAGIAELHLVENDDVLAHPERVQPCLLRPPAYV
jgi:hypothetical protein